MEQIVIYLLMVQKLLNLKHSEIVATPLCLGNISKDFCADNMKKPDYMDMFMILVLIMMLLQLKMYWTFTSI